MKGGSIHHKENNGPVASSVTLHGAEMASCSSFWNRLIISLLWGQLLSVTSVYTIRKADVWKSCPGFWLVEQRREVRREGAWLWRALMARRGLWSGYIGVKREAVKVPEDGANVLSGWGGRQKRCGYIYSGRSRMVTVNQGFTSGRRNVENLLVALSKIQFTLLYFTIFFKATYSESHHRLICVNQILPYSPKLPTEEGCKLERTDEVRRDWRKLPIEFVPTVRILN